MKVSKIYVFGLLGVGMLISSFLIFPEKEEPSTYDTNHIPSMKGLCWVAGDSIASHNIDHITNFGANWISQTPFGWMQGIDQPFVRGNTERAWWGEADRGIRHTTALAKEAGVKTMLKPHIWLRSDDGKWRQDIKMKSEEDWVSWFASYEEWILHYAVLAQECKIESLCIGTELHQTIKRTDEWRHMIREIRKVYDGDLTYAANWYKEYEDVQFWDELDYIGIQGYFPLSKKDRPNKKELVKAWSKHKSSLARLSKKYDKKVVFTEIGYKNTADAANKPWTWPQNSDEDVVISDETQKVCYEAMFESLWHESWMDGIFIWKWFHTTYKHNDEAEYFLARDARRKEWAQRRNRKVRPPVYFTPQRSDAMEVLEAWYGDKDLN